MQQQWKTLEFDKIRELLAGQALSARAKTVLFALTPYLDETSCVRSMRETTAARAILDACGSPPLPVMQDMDEILALAEADAMLLPEQLASVLQFAASCKRLKAYCKRGETVDATIAGYGRWVEELPALQQEIERCIRGDAVSSEASPALKDVRRRMEHAEAQIKEKLNHVLASRKKYLSDSFIAIRNGRYVLPVLRQCQHQFGGTVVEVSGKGGTVFMEPDAVSRLADKLNLLQIDEENEVRRILYALSALVADEAVQIRRNMEASAALDVLFAKAKLSALLRARPVEIGGERRIEIHAGRHPLLPLETCVPLDFMLGGDTRGVIITGPNTGGKTVAVKTVGLLTLMAQCALHIPCESGYIAMQDAIYCDIGDGQSIEQNLSTFSSHMTNIIGILEKASPDSLVLLDELGSGTDPAEGMGIAIAVLEALRLRGCLYLVTTHYPQVKAYAQNTAAVDSARMAFDRDTLQPLYRLEMGKSGESCALDIAKRLGLPEALLSRARQEAYAQPGPRETAAMPIPKSMLKRIPVLKEEADVAGKFQMGDSVEVLPGRDPGIVYKPADAEGNLIVQVRGEKLVVRHTRVKLRLPASELYPPDYDFSILFDTVENRKARKRMGKRHDAENVILYEVEGP